jgi:hypothetical protein
VRDDSTPATPGPDDDTPVTLEQLAELQAGLLDDATAARLRQRIRDDPELARRLAALDQVRRDLAGLDATPAPETPAEVTAQIGAALRAAQPGRPGPPTHAASHQIPWRRTAAVLGVTAAAAGIGVGTVVLLDDSEHPPASATGPTAEYLKAPRHSGMPLPDRQIVGLLSRAPNLGPLADAAHRDSCLRGLGYATDTPVLGATTLDSDGGPQVVLVLPGTAPKTVMALLVTAKCNAADAGLLADAVLTQP